LYAVESGEWRAYNKRVQAAAKTHTHTHTHTPTSCVVVRVFVIGIKSSHQPH